MNFMHFDSAKILESKIFKSVLVALVIVIPLVGAFKLGEFVGSVKARFSFRWGENYHQNFGGPHAGLFGDFMGKDYMGAHGAFGAIIKIDGNSLVIRGRDNVERVVMVSDATVIQKQRTTVKFADLAVDTDVTVIGSPNEKGQIEAKFIRIFDGATSMPMMRR